MNNCGISMLCYQLILAAGFVGVTLGLLTGSGPAVDLWLSADEAARIIGPWASSPHYIIRDGVPNLSMTPAMLGKPEDNEMGVRRLRLPADINFIKITWRAPKPFHYTFMELGSSDLSIMGPPLLSITLDDSMPSNDTEFRMDLPCTGQQSGTASVSVILAITHSQSGFDIPASPIHLTFDKQCIEAPTCEPRCANGGKCNQLGRCDCTEGFYGHTCRIVFCIPHCYNSGTCIAPGECKCRPGFIGNRCQKAICDNDCNGNGYCYRPGSCYCYRGWTGSKCQKQLDRTPETIETATYRSKNLRLVKNRRFWSDAT